MECERFYCTAEASVVASKSENVLWSYITASSFLMCCSDVRLDLTERHYQAKCDVKYCQN